MRRSFCSLSPVSYTHLDVYKRQGDDGYHAYFVHSYHFQAATPEAIIATSEYGGTISAIVGQDNIVGTQFHPEKSQRLGLAFIGNFLRWNP